MSITEMFAWLTSENGLMALLAQNWVLGTLIIALIIFVETGLVIMPFLPGDSLLFAAGAFLGLAGIDPLTSIAIITAAAIAGDALNYTIGSSRWGQKLAHSRWIKPAHMERAREYFARFGAMTITVARFVPIVRTLAPFVAGLSQMPRGRFYAYNVVGGVVWCSSMMLAGYWLGSIPWVRANLHWVSVIIIGLSLIPVALQWLQVRRLAQQR
ncbi:VTT domain-containing protein [Achromobacter sp. Marseille-Q0513]|jgi:membrane-associated protein|uniref:VTT domain-containing protein n=1 Tax=unclassified Achromobacter TaxID=2626865 RepID=UPI000CD07C07|nr:MULTISPECIES: VTT domain-containing protein [unclassified Achromobacter]AUT48071.1 alkaline phosphatase [Achromobacter sp. AONIH1]MBR8652233.1 VTT domain-containing protein [Achromobacter sp. Marseille-Q0513]